MTMSVKEDDVSMLLFQMQFSAPVILASCVEGVWSSLKTSSTDKQHLVEALWLNCGVSGMKVRISFAINSFTGL